MLTRGEDEEVHALRKRGWSYSAIARHLGGDRRTVEAYLNDGREPGRRRRSTADSLERFVPYLRERFTEDPHVWASALFDEVVALGYERSYRMRARGPLAGAAPALRGVWGVKGRDRAISTTHRARSCPVALCIAPLMGAREYAASSPATGSVCRWSRWCDRLSGPTQARPPTEADASSFWSSGRRKRW